ncbi:MAG: GNAT family protein [Pseudomonadota bacterium]
MPKIPKINTPRLLLRGLQNTDAADIASLIGEWDVARMLARPPYPYTLDDAHSWLAQAVDYPWEYAIQRAGTEGLIGVVGVTGHLGFWLGKPFWGQGYMTEAATAMIATYFEHAKSTKIISGAFADNPGSLAVQTKLGFVQTGRSRQYVPARGEEVDHIDLALRRADWPARTLDAAPAGGERQA